MGQVLRATDTEDHASAERSASRQTPPPRPADAPSRGIKFPISQSRRLIFSTVIVWLGVSSVVRADLFDIVVNFTGGLTPSQQAVFTTAEAFWESSILGYLEPGVPAGTQLSIDAAGQNIDGPGGIFGSAEPTQVIPRGSFLYAVAGEMTFDSADLSDLETAGVLFDVVAHEMGHVIGFGTLWSSSGGGIPGFQELYVTGSGQYTGANAIAAYNKEFRQNSAFVPVELEGGILTANLNWDEVDGGSALTGIVGPDGDMVFELMTGWLNAPTFLSDTTLAQFEDLGYDTTWTIPEPSTVGLLVMAAGLLLAGRRRRR